MADILIRGMELPKSGGILCINISPEGKVTRQFDLSCKQIATAVPLPEGHGRLGDLDALQEEFKKYHDGKRLMLIDTALTIVPAEGGENE